MKFITTLLLFTICFVLPLLAQPTLPSDPAQTPIDGGLIWLLAGGGAYGIHKLKQRFPGSNNK